MSGKQIAIAAAHDLPTASGGEAPGLVHLMPAGKVEGVAIQGKGPWYLKDGAAVIAASETGRDLPIDYDHAMDLTRGTASSSSRAAGWITKMELREDGIWGHVEWAGPGGKAVAAKEYRYLSPVFIYDEKTGEVARILRASLTNDPAIKTLTALAAAQSPTNEGDNDVNEFLKALATALGLPEDADQDAVLAAVKGVALASKAEPKLTDDQRKALATAAGLPEGTAVDKITEAVTALATAKTGEPDPKAYVPMGMYTGLQEQVTALASGIATKDANARVETAMASGKVSPAMKNWATALATKDPQAFDEFVANAPALAGAGSQDVSGAPPKDGSLTPEDKAVCSALDLSEDDFNDAGSKKKESE